jgi:putative transposase
VKHLNIEEHDQLSKAFKQLFTSYAKAINKQENRHGSLFEKPFKRIEITSVNYLSNLVFYIHANPQLHGIADDFKTYRWSSYDRILNNKASKLKKEEVLTWFDDKSNYVAFHNQKAALAIDRDLLLED